RKGRPGRRSGSTLAELLPKNWAEAGFRLRMGWVWCPPHGRRFLAELVNFGHQRRERCAIILPPAPRAIDFSAFVRPQDWGVLCLNGRHFRLRGAMATQDF